MIGTNHELQHDGKPNRGPSECVLKARNCFSQFLRSKVKELSASVIVEESAQEVLSALAAKPIAREVALEVGIEHCFCEPSSAERAALGVPSGGTEGLPANERVRVIAARERYWLGKLQNRLDRPVLFICGAAHVQSFVNLLRSEGVLVKILEPYLGKEIYEPQPCDRQRRMASAARACGRASSQTFGVTMQLDTRETSFDAYRPRLKSDHG